MTTLYIPRTLGGVIILQVAAITYSVVTFTEFNGPHVFATDAYTPRFVGDLAEPLQANFVKEDGITAYDLTSSNNWTMTFRSVSNPAYSFVGTGSWGVVNYAQGIMTYAFSSSDVASAGAYEMIPSAYIGGLKHFMPRIIEFM